MTCTLSLKKFLVSSTLHIVYATWEINSVKWFVTNTSMIGKVDKWINSLKTQRLNNENSTNLNLDSNGIYMDHIYILFNKQEIEQINWSKTYVMRKWILENNENLT